MLSVKAKYRQGKLIIEGAQSQLPERAQVLVTCYSPGGFDSPGLENKSASSENRHRQHERFMADGMIAVLHEGAHKSYPLYDYSQGGLSFTAPSDFAYQGVVQAGITDPFNPDTILMEIDLEIRSLLPTEKGVRVGCRFLDQFDEDLWHGLQMFWG